MRNLRRRILESQSGNDIRVGSLVRLLKPVTDDRGTLRLPGAKAKVLALSKGGVLVSFTEGCIIERGCAILQIDMIELE